MFTMIRRLQRANAVASSETPVIAPSEHPNLDDSLPYGSYGKRHGPR